MKSVFINFDKTYLLDLNENNNIITQISNKINLDSSLFNIRYNGKLYTNQNITNNSQLFIVPILLGGRYRNNKNNRIKYRKHKNKVREDFLFKGASNPFGDIIKPLSGIWRSIEGTGNFFTKDIPNFFKFIWKLIMWIFDFIIWIFTDLLNPMIWIEDVIMGFFVGLQLLGAGIMDGCIGIIRKLFNLVFGPLIKGVWGDDYVTKNNSKCYKMPDCSVPYPVLFATIILPPLGVFMELGLKGWLNILICAVLTLLLYLPGLIYALILLYC
jgi:uncharacterized membrane protein YqaE (UPF0057 family)